MPKRSLTFDFGSIEAPTIPKARVVRPLRRNGPHKVAQRSRHCSAAEDSTGCQLKPKRFTRDELRSPLGPDDFTSSQDTKLDSGNASDTSLGSLLGQIEDQCVETDREDSPLWEEENEVIDASLLYNGSPSPSPSKRSFQRTWSDEKGKAVEIEEEDSTRRSKKRSREERSGDEADDEAEGKKMRYKRSRKVSNDRCNLAALIDKTARCPMCGPYSLSDRNHQRRRQPRQSSWRQQYGYRRCRCGFGS